jgi:hypothetical protein
LSSAFHPRAEAVIQSIVSTVLADASCPLDRHSVFRPYSSSFCSSWTFGFAPCLDCSYFVSGFDSFAAGAAGSADLIADLSGDFDSDAFGTPIDLTYRRSYSSATMKKEIAIQRKPLSVEQYRG